MALRSPIQIAGLIVLHFTVVLSLGASSAHADLSSNTVMRSEKAASDESLEVRSTAAFKKTVGPDIGDNQYAAPAPRDFGKDADKHTTHPLMAHWHLQNIENNANVFTKKTGGSEYDAEALTTHGNVMSIKVKALQTDKAFRIGLTSNEWDHADFEHGYFLGFYDRGRLYVPDWTVQQYTKNDEFTLKVMANKMTLWKNGAKIHTWVDGRTVGPMHAALYIHDVGAKAQITQMSITANLGGDTDQTIVLANQGPNGPSGEAGPPGPPGVWGRHGDPGPPATHEMLFQAAPLGPDGPRGEGGDPGEDGAIGPRGAPGLAGAVGATGDFTDQQRGDWQKVVQELDAGIKKAADMDRTERKNLNARMNAVNEHLTLVEVEVGHQEELERLAQAAAAKQKAEADAAAAEEIRVAEGLATVKAEGVEVQHAAEDVKNELVQNLQHSSSVSYDDPV